MQKHQSASLQTTTFTSSSSRNDTHLSSRYTEQQEEPKVQGAHPVSKHLELQGVEGHREKESARHEAVSLDSKSCRGKRRELQTVHSDIISDKFWSEHPEILGRDGI